MKAEERKHLQRNELESRIKTAWSGLNSSSKTANRIWTGILVVFVLIVAWVLYSRYTTTRQSDLWTALDFAYDLPTLEKIAKENPMTIQGHIARLQAARVKTSEGFAQIGVQNGDEKAEAAKKLEDARTAYAELAKAHDLPIEILQECVMQQGRIEETLSSVPKADVPTAMRGSLDDALKQYDDLATRYPKSYFGAQAKKRADDIRAHRGEIEKLYAGLAEVHAKAPPAPLPLNVTPAEAPPAAPK